MARERFTPRPVSAADATPFDTAEEAWFWFWQCQIARDEGARVVAGAGTVTRPCDPDDLYRVVARLHDQGALSRVHIHVLCRFGRLLTPPDDRAPAEAGAAVVWTDGMARLESALQDKGIVARAADEAMHGGCRAAAGAGR